MEFKFVICYIIIGMKVECEASEMDFIQIVEDTTFVDKTSMIKDLFSAPAVKLITAPPRFGKTTNIKMVKRFLEIEVDKSGKAINTKSTQNYKLFEKHDLNILKHQQFVEEHLGKHPVVFIDYTPLGQLNGFDSVLTKYTTILRSTFSEHEYLAHNQSLWLDEDAKVQFYKYVRSGPSTLTEDEIKEGFIYLARLLRAHFGRPVFVLMDGYDAFVNTLLFAEPDDNIVTFIQEVNSALLEPNRYVSKAVLTGVLRVTGRGLRLPGVNITDYYFMGEHPFTGYYGITEKEVDDVLNKIIQDVTERNKTKAIIEEYYKGYAFNNTHLYNIMSVLKYLKTKELKSYWHLPKYINTFLKVFTSPDILHIMQELLYGNTMEIDISKPFAEKGILMLNHIFSSAVVQSSARMEIFMVFLYHVGYLSLSTFHDYIYETNLRIPNEEVKYELAHTIAHIYTSVYRFNQEHIQHFRDVMDSFSPQDDNSERVRFLCKTVDDLFTSEYFQQRTEKDYQTILYIYLFAKPKYSHTKALTESSTEDSLVGRTYVLLTNRYSVDVYINVRSSLAVDEEERLKKAEKTLKKIVNDTYHVVRDRMFQVPRCKIFIGVCFDVYKKASIAYSYYFNKGDDLDDFKVIS